MGNADMDLVHEQIPYRLGWRIVLMELVRFLGVENKGFAYTKSYIFNNFETETFF